MSEADIQHLTFNIQHSTLLVPLLCSVLACHRAGRPHPSPVPEPHFSSQCEALKPIRVVNNEIEPPVLVHRVDPKLVPANAVVILGTIIDRDGNVCDAVVMKGAGRAADAAAIDAVRQWTFRPMRFHGQTWACVYYVTVNLRSRARDT